MEPIKRDIISPNTGPWAASGPMTATTQAVQADAARGERRKQMEAAKQEKYKSMLAELEAPWVRDAGQYKKMKDAFNKQLVDYYRENGRMDLTDPTLLKGYQDLKDFAVYSNQTKKAMEDVLSKVNPEKQDDIHFRKQMQRIQSIQDPFERAAVMADINSKGGFFQEKYLDYGKTLEELEPEIKGTTMKMVEGTARNNKERTVLASSYIAQQVKNRLQSELGMKSWIYALEGELDVPDVDGFSYEAEDGIEQFKPVNIEEYRAEYDRLLNAYADENGNLSPEGMDKLDKFIAETNEEYIQAYSQNRAQDYISKMTVKDYTGPSRYKKEERPMDFFTVTGEIPVETAEGKFTAKNYGGAGMQKATYFPIANTMAEQLGAGDSDEAAVARYYTMYGTPDDTYITLIFKQAEAADYDDAFSRLNVNDQKLFQDAAQKSGTRDPQQIIDYLMQDKSVDNRRASAIKQKLGLSGRAGVPRTFRYNQVKDIVESNPNLQRAIEEMWAKHTQDLDAVPRTEEEKRKQEEAPNKPEKKSGNWLKGLFPGKSKNTQNQQFDKDI